MKLLIIIPTYNEIENINELITEINKINVSCDILIIDDNSPDGTAEYIKNNCNTKNNIKIYIREKKMGLGSAILYGITYGIRSQYDYIITMDGDNSHNPEDISKLFTALSDDTDIILGSRYIYGSQILNWSKVRLYLSKICNFLSRIYLNIPYNDITSGFRLYKTSRLKEIDLYTIKSINNLVLIEILYMSHKKGLSIKEYPIAFLNRNNGKSKLNIASIFETIIGVLKLKLRF